uniref:Uncharacterized protein n=1 Tax=Kalanchoe fedtschenkoi TaxID=63787 RepID=A0A7N0T8R9_KALFE
MATGEKFANALRAMGQLGISSKVVEPVLERLLQVCEGKWEHIEAGNYQLLAEAIFEDGGEGDIKNDLDDDGTEPPLKKLHLGHDRDSSVPSKMEDPIQSSERISDVGRTTQAIKPSTSSHAMENYMAFNTHEMPKSNGEKKAANKPSVGAQAPVAFSGLQGPSESSNAGFRSHGTGDSRQQAALGPTQLRRVKDISKGLENVPISLIYESNSETLPRFFYARNNVAYQSAYVHVSYARISDEDSCSGCVKNCLLRQVPCACARETGGEFAYTPQGLLKEDFLETCISMSQNPAEKHLFYCEVCPLERNKNESKPEPCKGHLLRKFIKECWTKCGCSLRCGNRIVQRGITRRLEVFVTRGGKGWGLRTLEELPKGSFVCEYVGEILTNTELYERNASSKSNERHTYPVLLDSDWGSEGILKDEEALCLDATFYGNCARFINHRCQDANLIEIPVQIETPDRHYYHLAFFTKRVVNAMEELTWDYAIDFDDEDHPVKAFECTCGSEFCRDKRRKAGLETRLSSKGKMGNDATKMTEKKRKASRG